MTSLGKDASIGREWAGVLDAAAGELTSASAATSSLPISSRLRCLDAVEHLTLAGATPATADENRMTAEQRITAALQILAALPIDVFENEHIIEAAASARRALQLLS